MKSLHTVRGLVPQLFALAVALMTGGVAQAQSGSVVISSNTTWATGSYQLTSLTVNSGATLTVGGGSTLTVSGSVLVTADSSIVLQGANTSAQVNSNWVGTGVTLNAASVEVDAGSSINTDGQGYLPSAGPGGGPSGSSTGGSYGGLGGDGYGGVAPAAIYGSVNSPTDLGSGGGVRCCGGVAGTGGGALRLAISGTLTNNGIISANGMATSVAPYAGGGSGGSVWITTNALVGSGSFAANGGAGGEAGGGGGRIAIYYNGASSTFTGFATSTASGGVASNGNPGSNGTAGFIDTSVTNNNLNVYQDFPLPANANLSYNAITVNTGAVLTIGGGTTITIANALTVSGMMIAQSVNTTAQVNGNWAGVGVTIKAASLQVSASGSIVADGQGYAPGSYSGAGLLGGAGPGGGPSGASAGGSYGGLGGDGYGGVAPSPIYGSATAPTDLGSGGAGRCCNAVGGAGGGAIILTVTGTLTDNGVISANGATYSVAPYAGGGSGGSLYITTNTLAGSGSIAANGGAGGEAGGGGGRIAVYYTTNSGFNLALVTANGGAAASGNPGAAGTVDTLGAGTVLTVSDDVVLPGNQALNYTSITINNQGSLTLGSGTTLTAGSISISDGGNLTVGGGSTVTVSGTVLVTGNSSIVLQAANTGAATGGVGVTLTAPNLEVDAGSFISADGQGYLPNDGPGGAPIGPSGNSAGGSYGGLGGAGYGGTAPGPIYGSSTAPVDLGSGGGARCCDAVAGAGGGAMRLAISGTLTNNGIISANGAPYTVAPYAGGGSGGSIWITTGTLTGTGSIAANGGAGGEAAGGGGRIAVYYATNNGFNLTLVTANGGATTQGNPGAPGTVYTLGTQGTNLTLAVSDNMVLPANSTLNYTTVTINNQGSLTLGSGTTITAGSLSVSDAGNLTVGGGSTVTVSGSVLVTGNSSIVLQGANTAAQVSGNWAGKGVTFSAATVEVDAGSSINADGQGYLAGGMNTQGNFAGAGPGGGPSGASAGGSYGGLGGAGYSGVAPSPIYGSSTAPADLGSGGGVRCCGGVAGSGGGAIRLAVSGTLTVNGIISANGAPDTVANYAGGGSGGSLYITTSTLTGSGSIAANGGAGGEAGGGGGRIAVYFATNSGFNLALVTANGGAAPGGNAGASGTVYTLGTQGTNVSLTVSDNVVLPGNQALNYTSITVNNQGSLTMGGGTTLTAGTISVSDGGTFTVGGASSVTVSGSVLVTGNSNIVLQGANTAAQVKGIWAGAGVTFNAPTVEVDAGSSINADGQGYLPSAGPGGGPSGTSAGGSYGGLGGAGDGGATPAGIYGSVNTPTDLGSGGGVRCCGGVAGDGGGAITLTVSGTLTVNGIISANGAAESVAPYAGGGSGGSLWITTNALVGSGSFAANGGAGGEAGGGGGRIAVYYNGASSTFTGFATSTASGGAANGGNPGSNGTVGFIDTSVTNNNLNIYQDFPLPANANLSYNAITVNTGAVLTIGGGTTVNVAAALTVSGEVVPQAVNTTAPVDGNWAGAGVAINAASVQVNAGGSIVADGQGYAAGGSNTQGNFAGAGPGGGPSGASAGGSYGGLGGAGYGPVAPSPIYGSATSPTDLGSGGGVRCCNAVAGAGGGAIILTVTGTLTDNGIISANGAPYTVAPYAGGGSGGTVSITTNTLAGSGSIAANGGAGGEASGGGGRIVVNFAINSGFNLTQITANGGAATSGNPGAPGTVYTLGTSGANVNLAVSDNMVLPGNQAFNFTSITINNQGSLTLGSGTTLTAGSMTVSGAGSLTIGGGSNLNVGGTFLVTGNSSVIMQGLNTAAGIGGVGVTLIAANLEVDAGSSIIADGQGYLPNDGPGGAPSGSSAGGSYGGLGGAGYGGVAPAGIYGSATAPSDLGSGGGSRCCGAVAGAGGGEMRLLVPGTLTNNGIISANGMANGVANFAGGGAGGTVFMLAGTITGTGSIAANGGAGGEAGGGGGRIAIYYTTNSGFNSNQIAANGGAANGGNAGAAGTIGFSNTPIFLWLSPPSTTTVLYGTQFLEWLAGGVNLATTTVNIVASGPEILTLGSGLNANSDLNWDTTTVPDGRYELQLNFFDGNGNSLQQVPRTFVINNSVAWRSGTIDSNQEWTSAQVQGLSGTVIIPSGVTVTIDPGTVVKALRGAQIIVQSGGILNALGGASNPVIFTTFDDSSVGGDSDFSGGQTVPTPGEWNGISVLGSGQFNINSDTDIWYAEYSEGGTLTASTSWLGSQLFEVDSPVVVPSGTTLTIQPGAVVKFGPAGGITVEAGGQLIANGTIAQPIYFTSINDNSVGGTVSNSSGAPAPGDWTSIIVSGAGATASFDHVQMLYGSGPQNGENLIGMIETGSGSVVTVSNSILGSGFWNGFWTGSTGGGDVVTIENSVVYGMEDRGIDAWYGSTVNVINDTFDGNNSGIQGHGGTLNIANTIVSNSVSTNWGGVDLCGGGSITISYSDVWTSVAGSPDYACMTDPTGTHGNISANPVYVNKAQGNFRLNYGSPAIDAADGKVANYSLTDSLGDPRYNDPLVEPKTGVPDANGHYPDMGAFEFVQSAVSDIDLTVPLVTGPANAISGSQVQLTWTDANTGSGTAQGPWHDAVYLVQNPDTNPVLLLAGEVLVASGVTLGPSQSYAASGTVRVPGAPIGNYRWEVVTNDRGEVFVGQNSKNDSGISLENVAIDLPQLTVGSAAVSGAFSATGQSWWYKLIPGANQTVNVNLTLAGGASGGAGAVQLFIGQGYVPTPQHFDFQQVQFDSPIASVVIPNTSNQTYYVTAFAQSLTNGSAAFTIAASAVQFSLTSVQPNSVVNSGSATLAFQGGGFTSGATYQLVGSNSTVYGSSSVFVADSTVADVTFAMTGVPVGVYTAQVIENGSTVSLSNAVTVAAGGGTGTTSSNNGVIQVSVQAPEEFRVGFPFEVTLNYQNVSGSDLAAPVIWLSAIGATLGEAPPQCSGCNTNFPLMYENVYNSGLVLGINNQGPAGVLPAGAQGSVKFMAMPTGGNAIFTVQNIDPTIPDPLIGYQIVPYHNPLCPVAVDSRSAGQNKAYPDAVVCNSLIVQSTGIYDDAVALCNAYLPPFANAAGFSRTCMQFLAVAGYQNNACSIKGVTGNCATLDGAGVNNQLAADATALSSLGIYDSDGARLLSFELENDGLDLFNRRYHQGAFGFGTSHEFDVTAEVYNSAPIVHYPDGSTRAFPTVNPNQSNQYLGVPGDYGVITVGSDGTWTLTESNGIQYDFVFDLQPNSTKRQLLNYIQDLNGNRITLAYTNDLVTGASDNFGDTVAFVYDSLGHIVQATDPEGRVTTYTYDIKSDSLHSTFLTSITNSMGTTSIAWNEGGPSGVGYIADACVLTYCEPAIGINTITNPEGTHTYVTYDSLGRVATQSNDGPAQTLTFSYGNAGAVTITDGAGNVSQYAPNQYQTLAQYTDPLGSITQLSYDPEDKLAEVHGPMGTSLSLSYDSQGNTTTLIDPLGNQQSLSFTAYNNPQSFTSASGYETGFSHDNNYNLTGITYPDGSAEQATYDSHGNILTLTNRRGHRTTYTYNAENLLTGKTYANGSQVSYTYDGHLNLLTSTASNGTTNFTYNSADRLTGVTYPGGQSIQYAYNGGGQLVTKTDSTGFAVQYAYDAAGRLSQLTSGSAPIVSYTYDAAGRLTGKAMGNGTSTTYTYDADGNLLHLINYSGATVLSEFDYTFDALDRQITINSPSGAGTYDYDADSELTSVALPGENVQYTYDADGNWLSEAGASYNVNNLNEYTAAGATAYSYDADGNLISGGGWNYTYDDDNRLIGMVSSTDTWTYQYDGLGNRVVATHNGATTQYLNDLSGLGNVEAEFNGNGQLVAHYTFGLDLTSAVPASGTPAYYHFDGSGNTAQMTNSTGAVVNSYSYLAFGQKRSSTTGVNNPFTFVGEYGVMDEGSGLYFMRNRWYSPALGRFVEQDPIGFTGGTNLYAYTGNSPVNGVDPEGFWPFSSTPQIGTEGNTNPILEQNRENNQLLYDAGMISQSPAQRDEAIAEGSEQIRELGVKTVVTLAPEVEILANPVANIALREGVIAPVTEAVVMHGAGWVKPKEPGEPAEPNPGPELINPKEPTNTTNVPGGSSKDPNGKLTSGFGEQGFIPANMPIVYTIFYENKSTATAPAEEVVVTDPLSKNLDWSTVQLNQIQFNNVTINVPGGLQTYTGQVNVSTDPNPVSVNAALNPSTGVLTWTMQSVDPTTGGLPANPLAGFLPPNNAANQGTGYVTFSVMPKPGLADGTVISNQAKIVFDRNAAISTNTVINTIDSVLPTSSVNPLPVTSDTASFPVSWSGSDPHGAGIASYNIFVSVNKGPYSIWLSGTTATTASYPGAADQTYSFYSMATDNAGLSQKTAGPVQTTTVSYLVKPTMKVSPASTRIAETEELSVTVEVSSIKGNPTPTGSATLSSGTYKSEAIKLVGGSAKIKILAGSLKVGKESLNVTYTPDASGVKIYESVKESATVTVTKGKQTLTFKAPKTPVVYGVKPIDLSATASSRLAVKFTVASGPGKIEDGHVLTIMGAGTVEVEASQPGNDDYEPAEAIKHSIMVEKAKLTVKANNLSMVQGTSVPTLTYEITGFVEGDTQKSATTGKPDLTTAATSASQAGSYPITVTTGTLAAKNYGFSVEDGTMTVKPN